MDMLARCGTKQYFKSEFSKKQDRPFVHKIDLQIKKYSFCKIEFKLKHLGVCKIFLDFHLSETFIEVPKSIIPNCSKTFRF